MPAPQSQSHGQPIADVHYIYYLLSHGLRTPLTNLRLGLDALRTGNLGPLEETPQETVQFLYECTRELAFVLRTIFCLEQLERDRGAVKLDTINIAAKLNEAIDSLETKSETFQVTVDNSLSVKTHPEYFTELLRCLLLACWHSNSHQTITVSVEQNDDIHLRIPIHLKELPVLNHYETINEEMLKEIIVGGTPGLLLFLGNKISQQLGHRFDLNSRDSEGVVALTLTAA